MKRQIVGMLTLAVMVCSAGCPGPYINPQTPAPSPNNSIAQATLIVGEVTRPRDLVASAGNPFYAAMQVELPRQLDAATIAKTVMSERDLPKTGVQGKAFVLRYRVTEDQVTVISKGGLCEGLILGLGWIPFFIPYAFVGLCTGKADHRLTIEARVYNTDGVPVQRVQDSSSNDMLNVYDTSNAEPLLRKNYTIKYRVTISVLKRLEPNSPEEAEFLRKEAIEATRQVLATSLNDVANTLKAATVATTAGQ